MKKWFVILLAAMSGCYHYHLLTPAELASRGTRQFSQTTQTQAVEATASALETLGYKVTLKVPETGLLKTAPKVFVVYATGNASSATAHEDAVAWNVQVEPASTGVVIHASPRGFRNGTEITERGMPDVVIEPKFRDLWKEISSSLGSPAVEAAPTADPNQKR